MTSKERWELSRKEIEYVKNWGNANKPGKEKPIPEWVLIKARKLNKKKDKLKKVNNTLRDIVSATKRLTDFLQNPPTNYRDISKKLYVGQRLWMRDFFLGKFHSHQVEITEIEKGKISYKYVNKKSKSYFNTNYKILCQPNGFTLGPGLLKKNTWFFYQEQPQDKDGELGAVSTKLSQGALPIDGDFFDCYIQGVECTNYEIACTVAMACGEKKIRVQLKNYHSVFVNCSYRLSEEEARVLLRNHEYSIVWNKIMDKERSGDGYNCDCIVLDGIRYFYTFAKTKIRLLNYEYIE